MNQPQAPVPSGQPSESSGPDTPFSESVAGEEDPGASLDMAAGPSESVSGNPVSMPAATEHPGDEAPEGTPGTGEGLCRECGGSGQLDSGPCPSCDGTGKVTVGVGGA
ncbi:MAG: hypothetical protein JWR74_3154 [Polaromonas sp.]|jgi:hypothetical protein|nr:hypothetical protein [Polaromonas sp.]